MATLNIHVFMLPYNTQSPTELFEIRKKFWRIFFHMHAHSLQSSTVLVRCYLLSMYMLWIFLATLNPKWLDFYFFSAFHLKNKNLSSFPLHQPEPHLTEKFPVDTSKG